MSQRNERSKTRAFRVSLGFPCNKPLHDGILINRPAYRNTAPGPLKPALTIQPMSDLDLMIANGWGNTRQDRLPKDWRVRVKGKGVHGA